MARIVDYQTLPSGGYLAMDDTGQSIPTAYLPPAVKMGIDQQKQSGMGAPPSQLRSDIAEAAMAPQPDNRLASNSIELPDQTITAGPPNPLDQGLHRAGQWVGDQWQGIKDAGAAIRAREAGRGNFSGIHNTDVTAANAAGVAAPDPNLSATGAPPPGSAGGAEAGGNIVPPDQRVQVGGQRGAAPISFAGGGARVIPGGERKAGEVMGSTSYDPDAQANLKRAQQNKWEATQKEGAAQQQADVGEANVMTQIPEGLRNLEAQRQDAEAIRQQSIASDMDKLGQLRQESRQDIDSSRIFRNQSNADKFWGALMVGLGQLSSGLTGQPNVALGILNKSIDNDIDDQKENRNNKRAAFQDQQSLYKDNLARFGDERQAEIVTKAQYLEHAQAQLASLRAQAKAPADEAAIDKLSASLQEESAKTDAEMLKVTHQVHTQVVPDRVVGGGGPKLENLNRSLVVQGLDGRKFLARDEKAAGDLNTKRAMSQTAIRAAGTMQQIANTPGFEKLDPTSPLVGQFNYAKEQFINSSNSLMGQGVTRDDDIKRYTSDVLGGPYGLATANKAGALAGKIHQGYGAILESSADTDTSVNEGPEVDPKTGTIKKGVHYDAGELLGGQRQGGQVSFTPAGGQK